MNKFSKSDLIKFGLAAALLICAGCVVDPYYDEPAPRPYGYYGGYYGGYAPAWGGSNVDVDIGRGWGHGGYYGHGGGYRR